MSLDDIKALPIREIAAKDAVLFMWVTNPMLEVGIEVMRSWGFRFKTVAFVWSKQHASGKDVANLGRWTMANVELCLLGTRGHPKRQRRNIRQLVRAVRGRHSAKPVEVAGRIRELMGDDAYAIELFARGATGGWDQWGDEPDGAPIYFPPIDINTGLPEVAVPTLSTVDHEGAHREDVP